MPNRHPLAALALEGRRRARPRLTLESAHEKLQRSADTAVITCSHNGSPGDVMLQGFHRGSSETPSWHAIMAANAEVIKRAGFDLVWFPPVSASADDLGYLPTRWYSFDSRYGSATELTAAIHALAPVRAVADIVVNHRCGVATAGADFEDPPFPLDDQRQAVCSDDESGIGLGAPDTGEPQFAGRDLDHTNPGVQKGVIDYLAVLAKLGFQGFRFDQAKGYAPQFMGLYAHASKTYFAVAEYWDGNRQAVMNFIDGAGGRCTAFDFPTRMLLKSAIGSHDFSLLKTGDGKPTGAIGWWPDMSVTFVENHDTQTSDEFGNGDQVVMGYAYLLTHPGIPCVFWSHFFDFGESIQTQIDTLITIRKKTDLHRESVVNVVAAETGLYAAVVDGKVAMKLGPASWSPGEGWNLATSGNDYAVWTR